MKKTLIILSLLLVSIFSFSQGEDILRNKIKVNRLLTIGDNGYILYHGDTLNIYDMTFSDDTIIDNFHDIPLSTDKFIKVRKDGQGDLIIPTFDALDDYFATLSTDELILDDDTVHQITPLGDTLLTIEYFREYMFNSLLDAVESSLKGSTDVIDVNYNTVSVNYTIEFDSVNYYLDIYAWYNDTVFSGSDTILIKTSNAISNLNKTTTGFSCNLKEGKGYVQYLALDSLTKVDLVESFPQETDQVYANDSSYIKSIIRQFTRDSLKYTMWSDTIPTTGARIATGDDIKNMIDGSGTANFLPKFTDGNTVTNSAIKDDGTNVTIEQNSVQPFTSVASGAVDNTLYLSGGKVGIGTTMLTTSMNIYGADQGIRIRDNDISTTFGQRIGFIEFATSDGGTFVNSRISAITETATAGTALVFGAGDRNQDSPERFRLTSTGLALFNTTSGTKQLEINSATGANLRLIYNDADGSPTYYSDFETTSSGGLNITPVGDFQLQQNSVQPFTSVVSGAVDNTLYLSGGKVGINTSTILTTYGGLDIASGGKGLILGADNTATTRTNNTSKFGRMFIPHYINEEEPASVFTASSTLAENIIQIGGGTSLGNAATLLQFYTASNNTTTIGSERFRISSTGLALFNTTSGTKQVEINSATGANLRLIYNDADGSPTNYADLETTSGGDLTITPSGHDVTLSGSNLVLQSNTNASNYGIIYKGTTPFIHDFNYGNNGTVTTVGYNVFIGGAGNLTMGATATQTYHASNNTFSGFQAGFSNTTGYSNTILGYQAGYYNTTSYQNTFLGLQSGYYNTTGYNNTFLGHRAGFSNTTGSQNTFSGYQAGYYNTTGSQNTFLGLGAGRYITGGITALTIVDNSLFLGADTKAKQDNSTNEIAIGYGTIGNGSNTATWGNTSMTNHYFTGKINADKLKITQITAALTDNTPTDAEIDTATGLTPSTAGAGWQATIKDNNGSGLLYKVESDGTDWYYSAMTKAL